MKRIIIALMKNDTHVYDEDFLYEVLKNRDRRFDGRFFFGVTSTKIYCRPICPSRRPKRENCRFFDSAAAAEKEGFRPCLRCRPELAPGESTAFDGDEGMALGEKRLAVLAARALQCEEPEAGGVGKIAASLGVSDRHLRRVFAAHYGVSPLRYAQTCRLLFARRLVLETGLPFTQVAMSAGFGSVRRMNALFRERYRCNPTELRRGSNAGPGAESVSLRLPCRPPYAWRELLDFLARRAVAGVEEVEGSVYRRVVVLESKGGVHKGWIAVSPDQRSSAFFAPSTLKAEVSLSLAPVLGRVTVRLKRLFDTDSRPEDVEKVLGDMTEACPGLRVPGCFDAFEMGVRAILGQQITVKAAHTLAARLAAALGEKAETPFPGLYRSFPTPRKLLETDGDTLGRMGVVRSRQRALYAFAEFTLSGGLEPRADIEGQIRDLQKLPGIGEWTAQYVAMRALDWPDAFPHTDYGVKTAMGNAPPGEILKTAERWRPWRAYATMYLWLGHGEKRKA
ncbi:MAG: DNA-3-methyladenine glycosylase 2 [Synergistaceae bacterium]|nr:DNA-3-methyladenine glycosylase 2 [Synergistaceae bacterium]